MHRTRKQLTHAGSSWLTRRYRLRRDGLLQRVIDRGELGVEPGAKPIHDSDDRERDASGDQPVLDGGSAGVVRKKFSNEHHPVFLREKFEDWSKPISNIGH
jgi:hypothetical protein